MIETLTVPSALSFCVVVAVVVLLTAILARHKVAYARASVSVGFGRIAARKMERVKEEGGGRRRGRKEGNTCRQTP